MTVSDERPTCDSDDFLTHSSHLFALRCTHSSPDAAQGFYRSAYVSARDGKDKFMAVTQFEATDCRRAIPCWDGPSHSLVQKQAGSNAAKLFVHPASSSILPRPRSPRPPIVSDCAASLCGCDVQSLRSRLFSP